MYVVGLEEAAGGEDAGGPGVAAGDTGDAVSPVFAAGNARGVDAGGSGVAPPEARALLGQVGLPGTAEVRQLVT